MSYIVPFTPSLVNVVVDYYRPNFSDISEEEIEKELCASGRKSHARDARRSTGVGQKTTLVIDIELEEFTATVIANIKLRATEYNLFKETCERERIMDVSQLSIFHVDSKAIETRCSLIALQNSVTPSKAITVKYTLTFLDIEKLKEVEKDLPKDFRIPVYGLDQMVNNLVCKKCFFTLSESRIHFGNNWEFKYREKTGYRPEDRFMKSDAVALPYPVGRQQKDDGKKAS